MSSSSINNPFNNAKFNAKSGDVVLENTGQSPAQKIHQKKNPRHYTSRSGDPSIGVATNAGLCPSSKYTKPGLYSFTMIVDMTNVKDPHTHVSSIVVGVGAESPKYIEQHRSDFFPLLNGRIRKEPGSFNWWVSHDKQQPYYVTCVVQVAKSEECHDNDSHVKTNIIFFYSNDQNIYCHTDLRALSHSAHNHPTTFYPIVKHGGNSFVEFEILENHDEYLDSQQVTMSVQNRGEGKQEEPGERGNLRKIIVNTIHRIASTRMLNLEQEESELRYKIVRELDYSEFTKMNVFLHRQIQEIKDFVKQEAQPRFLIEKQFSKELWEFRPGLHDADAAELRRKFRARLVKFFTKHAPYNLGRIDVILSNMQITPTKYFEQLYDMYGVDGE